MHIWKHINDKVCSQVGEFYQCKFPKFINCYFNLHLLTRLGVFIKKNDK